MTRGPFNCNLWPDGTAPHGRRLLSCDFVFFSRGRSCSNRTVLLVGRHKFGSFL